jgi:predicted DNA-binding transcriptional regulator AlpA
MSNIMLESDAENFLGPAFRGRRFLRVNELIEIGLIPNRQTLSAWVAEGRFPRPLYMGPRVPLFAVSEIAATLAQRAAEREGVT